MNTYHKKRENTGDEDFNQTPREYPYAAGVMDGGDNFYNTNDSKDDEVAHKQVEEIIEYDTRGYKHDRSIKNTHYGESISGDFTTNVLKYANTNAKNTSARPKYTLPEKRKKTCNNKSSEVQDSGKSTDRSSSIEKIDSPYSEVFAGDKKPKARKKNIAAISK